MPKTGTDCPTSGIYRSDCKCQSEIALSKGETFPPCGACSQGVTWSLIRPTG